GHGLVLDVLGLQQRNEGGVALHAHREPGKLSAGAGSLGALRIALHPVLAEHHLRAAVALDAVEQPAIGNALEARVLEEGAQQEERDQDEQDVGQRRTEPRASAARLVELLAAWVGLSDHSVAPLRTTCVTVVEGKTRRGSRKQNAELRPSARVLRTFCL